MTADNYLFFVSLFVASGLFLWLLGRAVFDRNPQEGSIYRAPWLGYGLLVAILQVTHLFLPVNGVVIWLNPDGIQTYDSPLPSSWRPRPFVALLDPEKGIAGGFKYLRPLGSAGSSSRTE